METFSNNDVKLSYINSIPSKVSNNSTKNIDIFVDIDGGFEEKNVQSAFAELKSLSNTTEAFKHELVPWFPKSLEDFNRMGKCFYVANEDLKSDRPAFTDMIYRKRRQDIVDISNAHVMGPDCKMPDIDYTEEENNLWGFIWDTLVPLHRQHASREFLEGFENFCDAGVFRRHKIPQLSEISNFLKKKTNSIFRPIGGMMTQREFLNALAFRVFHSTQYFRHPADPLYTPEPDSVHEFFGHGPFFANQELVDFSQEIGLASLGASDEDIKKLGTLYLFTVEFGLCLEKGQKKIYGAGILSSPNEIEFVMSDKSKIYPFDVKNIINHSYNLTEYQYEYFLNSDMNEMIRHFRKYLETINRPFNVTYNADKQIIQIDRSISAKL